MSKNNINLRVLFIMLLSIVMIKTNAQTGLNFQGVARTTNNVILASQAITIKLSILQGSSTGTADYVETRKVMTNAQGLFTAVIGDTGAISTLGNFTTINWKLSPKFLKIEMDAAAGNNFITMGTTQFQYVAYAQFAKSVDAENIVGIVPVTLGGTGVNSLTGLKTALTLNNVNNTTDLAKPISTLTQTALDLKLNAADTSKYTKQTYSDSALLTKLNTTSNAATATTAGNITATTNTTLTSLSNLTTVGTLIAGAVPYSLLTGTVPTFNQNTTGNAATATTATTAGTATTTTGNAGTATKLATARTINGVAFDGSENINITASADAGTLTGTTLVATVTGSSLTSVGTLANLTVTNQIAGSITGNAATATTAGNITATTNTTLTSLSNLTTVGTLIAGAVPYSLLTGTVPTFNQNTTGNAATATTATTAGTATTTTGNAGTATKLATARTINGVAFDGSGNIDITASADAGTLTGTTLNATVTGSSLTSVGTLANLTVTNPISGSITGNAATATLATNATTAGNITATTNTTLTSLSNLATVGTITSGVWSGTAVAVEKGGTGLTSAGTIGNILTSNGTTWTSAAPSVSVHTIGESYGGGIVFYVTTGGLHGLIAETQDQSSGCLWYDAQDQISTTGNHSSEGQLFTDWRLPTKYELNLLYIQQGTVGGFASSYYWSSTEFDLNNAWARFFNGGFQFYNDKGNTSYVRAIRAF